MSQSFLRDILDRNKIWAAEEKQRDPGFFSRLAKQQAPSIFWIGCSDARVSADRLLGLEPGQVFVHRNVANLVHNIDLNCLSVLEFAVEVLKVRHIIVCGHYGCGGVRAAMERNEIGLIDNWLRQIKDIRSAHADVLEAAPTAEKRINMLCEMNVRQQVLNICHTTIVQNAWNKGQSLSVHGWIYSIHDGLLHDLDFWIDGTHSVDPVYQMLTFAETPNS
ncbi:MAG TPA: carbonate dehydratase [Dongiaceae bacterium]|jgi:carbonic anhydrase